MTATEVLAAGAPAWNVWTVLATASAGAVVALLVDFFLKPRLQVRNEKFSQRAKDQMEVVKVVRALMIESRKGINSHIKDADQRDLHGLIQNLIGMHNEERLAKLRELSDDMATAYAVGGHHLRAPVLRLVEISAGLLQGLLLAGVDMDRIERRIPPYFNLLYDMLMTSRFQFIAYGQRLEWVRRVTSTTDSQRQLAILRLYGMSTFGK